uniref:Pentacotripeptide-repeat region of PRORP domain-containing protein n=1 Tax=Leersia perrieri TaxID=77586 RepID=A0A0D9W9Z4_9ORYZ
MDQLRYRSFSAAQMLASITARLLHFLAQSKHQIGSTDADQELATLPFPKWPRRRRWNLHRRRVGAAATPSPPAAGMAARRLPSRSRAGGVPRSEGAIRDRGRARGSDTEEDALQVFDELLQRGKGVSIYSLSRPLTAVARDRPAAAVSCFNRMARAGADKQPRVEEVMAGGKLQDILSGGLEQCQGIPHGLNKGKKRWAYQES